MELGTNYPLGPFAWSERWSEAAVLEVLDALHAEYGDVRYRASRRLRASARQARGRRNLAPAHASGGGVSASNSREST
jgi:hypothetical protein